MDSQEHLRKERYARRTGNSNFEIQLQDAIVNHLNSLSAEGKGKVLEFINTLIDAEQKKLEFNRRQGWLYNWLDAEE